MDSTGKSYGVAIIGCGARGTAHANAWSRLDDVDIRVVRDIDAERAETLARAHGAEVAGSHEEAVARGDIDIVSVCTPAFFHPEHMICAADHSKHVLCEKPMALSLTEADAMIAAAEKSEGKLTFSFQNQYSEVTETLRTLMDAGEIGRPVMTRIISMAEIRPKLAMHSKTGNNGPIVDAACHYFTLWRYIFRSEPVRVQAGGLTIAKDAEELHSVPDLAIDTATVIVTFASGDIGVLSTTWGLPRGTKSGSQQEILGPNGVLRPGADRVSVIKGAEETLISSLSRGGDNAQEAAFLDCIKTDSSPKNTARDAYIALQVSLAAIESMETGQAVPLDAGCRL